MADTRINALSTATVSETTDFLPIDGGTGTRKLSAYSPSFGGNATVGGTLTVNGSGDSTLTGPLSWGTTVPVNALLLYKTGNTKYGNGLTSGSWNNFVPAGGNKHSWGYMSTSDGTSYTELATLTANTGVMAVLGTTASTTTSSGALVVGNGTSGGLGVGGSIYAGGLINVASTGVSSIAGGLSMGASGTNNGYITINGAAGGLRSYLVQTAGVIRWRVGADTAAESGSNAGSDFHIYSYTDAGAGIGEAFKITRSNSAAAFAGSITTGAPAGGTAAAWKLGTVASVSPTSPNRTIEVDIGGTIYYIHAKTTNN